MTSGPPAGPLAEPQNLEHTPQESAEPSGIPGARVVGRRRLGRAGRRGGAVGRHRRRRRARGGDRRAGRPTTAGLRRRGPARADRRCVRAGVAVRSKCSRALGTEPSAGTSRATAGGPGTAGLRRARSPRTGPLPPGRGNGAARARHPVVRITAVGRRALVDRRSGVIGGTVAGRIAGDEPQPSDGTEHRHRREQACEPGAQTAAPPGHDHTPLARKDQLPGSPHCATSCPSHRCRPAGPGGDQQRHSPVA